MKSKKHLIRILTALLIVSSMLLAACTDTNKPLEPITNTDDSTEQTDTVDTTEQPMGDRELKIIDQGSTDYVIIISENAKSWERNAALTFKDTIKVLTGVTLKVKTDTTEPTDKEILFGKTNRENLFDANYDSFDMGYRVFSENYRFIVLAGSPAGMRDALARFFLDYYSVDLDTWVPTPSEIKDLYINRGYKMTKTYTSAEFPYIGVPLKEYTLIYNSNDTLQNRYGVQFKAFISSVTNENVPVSNTKLAGGKNLILNVDPEMDPISFRISVSGTDITVSFANYYGFGAARTWLQKEIETNLFYNFGDNFEYEGNYKMFLKDENASAVYAFKRAGAMRVMFNNILWGSSSGADGRTGNDIPALERNSLTAAMAEIYQPDVFGLQEYSENGPTQGTIKPKLEALGYTAIYYGNRGDNYAVSTPLFYRADSVTLIKSGFKVFENQPLSVDNSKSVTWGVFESKGSRFIVASVHFCTQDKEIGALQVGELMTIINALKAEYGCSAIIGGDYNSNIDEATYKAFVNAGYVNAHDYAMESIDVRTNQWYPKFDTVAGIMKPGVDKVIIDAANSVDHIMVSDLTNFAVDLFGVVVDDITMSASDHLPIFIDFSKQDLDWTERY